MPAGYPESTPQRQPGQALPACPPAHRRQVHAGIPGRLFWQLLRQFPSACPPGLSPCPPRTAFLTRQGQARGVPPASPTSMAFLRRARALCPPRQRHTPGGACRFQPRGLRRSLWSRPLPTGPSFHSTAPSPHRPSPPASGQKSGAGRQNGTYRAGMRYSNTASSSARRG